MDASVFKNILNLLPEMVFVLNDKRTTVIFNKPVKELTGYEEGKLLSTPFEQFLPESFRDDFLKRILTPENSSAFEMQMTCSNSSILDVSAFMKRMVLNGNNYDVLIANDITERKQIELELLRFSNVIHHTTNPIQITDAQGTMIYVNPAFERISGYSQNDLVGNNPRMLNSGTHSKAFWKEMWETITSGEVWTGEVENKRRDGTRFQVELLISPILDDAGSIIGYLGSHRDITEQKKLERQLVRSQKMESIGTLAAGIAHEVGNPLTSISSLVQIIQRTSKDGFAQEKLELIKNQINRISQILRALVDFS